MRAAALHALALCVGVLLALAGSIFTGSGCICGPGPELYGIPRGTFPIPPSETYAQGLVPQSLTITGTALFLVYDEGEGPVEVGYAFDAPNGAVRERP